MGYSPQGGGSSSASNTATSSTTTSNGNAGGTTVIDSTLTQGSNYWMDMFVVINSGNSNGQVRKIQSFSGGTITVSPAFASQILSGTTYNIITEYLQTRAQGVRQVFEVTPISVGTLSSSYVLCNIFVKSCIIESIVVHANSGQPADLTSIAIVGGHSGGTGPITFIGHGVGTQSNLNATDKEVSWTGVQKLIVGKYIEIVTIGTGPSNVDLTITITYYSSSDDGGYLA